MAVPEREIDLEYLRRIESLAHDVVACASDEGWLSYMPDPDGTSQLQGSVNELARSLRHVHYEGDGCLER
jgi:hypothetical protein